MEVFLLLLFIVLSGPLSHQINCVSFKLTSKSQAIQRHRSQLWGCHFIFYLFIYRLVEKETSTGWYILKVKQAWWMIPKKALPNLDSHFFHELHRHQQPKETMIPIYRWAPERDEDAWAGASSSPYRCEGSRGRQPQEDAALAFTSCYQHG